MYDVLVVGGNLAGTSAAISAAEKKVTTVLIEKHTTPFNPPHCGEGIDPITASFINFDEINCTSNPIKTMQIHVSTNKLYTIQFKKKEIIIFDRYHLESALLKKTEQEGVDVYRGNPVTSFHPPHKVILADGTTLQGKIIIDASGINGVIGKTIEVIPKLPPQDIGVCVQSRVETDIDPDIITVWFHIPFAPFGYGWLFPIHKNLVNIGIGIPGGQHVALHSLLEKFIKHVCPKDYKILHTFNACVPSSAPISQMVKDNVLITGDAARLANAFLGSGIANAVYSGCLAGCIGADYLNKSINSLSLYQDLLQPKIKRLTTVYQRRNKRLDDQLYVKANARIFRLMTIGSKLVPNFFQKQVEKALGKDVALIRQYKQTPTIF